MMNHLNERLLPFFCCSATSTTMTLCILGKKWKAKCVGEVNEITAIVFLVIIEIIMP